MRLLRMHVRNVRCIDDSQPFGVAEVTCLVGKNEAGKTALLKALHKLKPDDKPSGQLKAARDFPRRKWRPDTPIPGDPPAIWTLWRLDSEEIAKLEGRFGKGALPGRGMSEAITSPTTADGEATNAHEFTLSKGYDNVPRVQIDLNERAIVEHHAAVLALSEAENDPLGGSHTVASAVDALDAVESRTSNQDRLLQSLRAEFPQSARVTVEAAVYDLVPTFLYFDQYLTLPGTVSVDDLLARKAELNDRERVFLALLSLAGTTLERLHEAGTFEEFNASLKAVSNQISDRIFNYWSQNAYLRAEVRLDHARARDKPPYNTGWVCRTRIENMRHRADTSFDERSSGFVWFFSFLVWFDQLRKEYGEKLVILLDEPGLTLHARAQHDLLRYINAELRPSYQVLYTTHSPFMIDPDNLLSARTVEDVVEVDSVTKEQRLLGTKVGDRIFSTDPDTVSPLQRALDYELTQTLFVGRHCLLVEGPSDLLYLKWFSGQLQRAKRDALDYRWTISIGRGVDRIPGFVSLFRGNGLHVAALVDVQANDAQKRAKAAAALLPGHLVIVSTFAEQEEADIEDVLGRDFYVALVNKALDLQPPHGLPSNKPENAPTRVAKEVDEFAKSLPTHVREFNHLVPAEWLFQHAEDGSRLPDFDGALSRMEKLITTVNSLIS